MTVTVKLKQKDEYLRLPKEEAEDLVRTGKARFADKAEWRRWLARQGDKDAK